MTDAPERIWADSRMLYPDGRGRPGATEYVRADLVPQWREISTAPRDGTEVLLLTPGGVALGVWEEREDDAPDQPGHDAGWYANGYRCDPVMWGRTEAAGFTGPGYIYEEQNQPTHWMPIPTPPETE